MINGKKMKKMLIVGPSSKYQDICFIMEQTKLLIGSSRIYVLYAFLESAHTDHSVRNLAGDGNKWDARHQQGR